MQFIRHTHSGCIYQLTSPSCANRVTALFSRINRLIEAVINPGIFITTG